MIAIIVLLFIRGIVAMIFQEFSEIIYMTIMKFLVPANILIYAAFHKFTLKYKYTNITAFILLFNLVLIDLIKTLLYQTFYFPPTTYFDFFLPQLAIIYILKSTQ